MSIASGVTDATFETDVLHADIPVLVDFWASWCQPCRMLAPVIEDVASEYNGRVKLAKRDMDENQTTAMAYSVSSIPTVMLFKNGEAVVRLVGFHTKDHLVEAIGPHL